MKTCRAGVHGYGGIHACSAPPKWSDDFGNVWCDEHRSADRHGVPTGVRIAPTSEYEDGVREGLRLAAEHACDKLAGLGGTVRKAILALTPVPEKHTP